MTAELGSAEFAFLAVLRHADREISNTEMDRLYGIRLKSPNYEKLNAAGYVASDTKGNTYRHAITKSGREVLDEQLSLDDDFVAPREKRSPRDRQLWAAVVVLQNEVARLAKGPAVAEPEPIDLEGRIRAAYAQLANSTGAWVDLVALRPFFPEVSKAELDKALVRMLDMREVQLEPDSLRTRVGAAQREAAVRVDGEDRHKLAIGRP